MTQQTNKDSDKKTEKTRKERVLHTRIPAVLEQELKLLAENLRVPVSNLVRTILQDALEAAEMVGRVAEEELRSAANRLAKERDRLGEAAAVPGQALAERMAASRSPAPDDSQTEAGEPPAEEVTSATVAEGGAEIPPSETPLEEPDVLAGVLGFQELMLAVPSTCARCGETLAVGSPAFLGVRDGPGPRVLVGPECLPKPT